MLKWLLPLALVLAVGCSSSPGPPTTPPAALTATPDIPPALLSRPVGVPTFDPFPRATTTIAGGGAVLWAPWPMEGRDPQRSGRAPGAGPARPQVRWSISVESTVSGGPVVAEDGTAYVATADGRLVAVSRAGERRWSVSVGAGPLSTPALGPDGTVYVRTADGTLHAHKPDGSKRWISELGESPVAAPTAPLVGPDRYVALASHRSSLFIYVQPGGFLDWAFNTRTGTTRPPALGPDGTVYGGTDAGTVWAVGNDGFERWSQPIGAPVQSAPAIDPDRGLYLLAGSDRTEVVALDLAGRLRWRTGACDRPPSAAVWPAIGPDGTVLVGNCALGADGSPRWRLDLGDVRTTAAAVDGDGTAYFGTSDGRVYAVSRDGSGRWTLPVATQPVGPPVLVGLGAMMVAAGDTLYRIE